MSSGFARQINAAVGGDLSGNLPNPTVVGITGNPIQPTTLISLNDGYIPTWVNVDGLIEWKPAPIGFAAGGDLSGSNTNQTVIGIDGRPVSSSAPSTGESLVWSGSAWAPSSVFASGPAGGDLQGTYPNPDVASAGSGNLSTPIYFQQRYANLPTDLGYQDQMIQLQPYGFQQSLNWYADNTRYYGYGMWMDISGYGSRFPGAMAGQSGMFNCTPYYGTFWNVCMGAITNSVTPSGQLCLLSNQTQIGTSNPLSTSGLSIGCSVNFPNQMFLSNSASTYNVNSGDRFDSGWITPNACIYNPFLNATSGGTYSNTLLSPSTTINGGSSDHVIAVDSSVAPYTVTLIDPQMSALQFPTYIISDVTGHAATNNITIQNPDSSTLTTINSNFGSVTVLWQTNSNAVDSHGVFTSGQYIVTSATSVNALQGYSLAISSPAPGNLLEWNGTDWIAATPPTLSTISSPVNTQTANYSVVQYTDYNIFVDTTTAAAPVSITLDSSPVNGETYYVKDSTGSASTYNITVSGSVNIDGASTYVINLNYACVAFTYNGSQWSVMGTYNGTLV